MTQNYQFFFVEYIRLSKIFMDLNKKSYYSNIDY
jgi:hypothetical protein